MNSPTLAPGTCRAPEGASHLGFSACPLPALRTLVRLQFAAAIRAAHIESVPSSIAFVIIIYPTTPDHRQSAPRLMFQMHLHEIGLADLLPHLALSFRSDHQRTVDPMAQPFFVSGGIGVQ